MSERKLRVLHVLVQPVLVWDDGQDLLAGPEVQPQALPLSAMPELPEQILAQIKAQEDFINSQEEYSEEEIPEQENIHQ